ncbi:MAG: pentapeptide repeat-containing protein [Xenococcaceae cyanobacterium MO_188.B32]|nr:pentapeptide repeat-containing protein [Xenococcaceae cyanobacterium MO_188.B32]
MKKQAQFIITEPLNCKGEAGEELVWNAIKLAFADRRCIAYWRYPIFSPQGKFRKEPDILIADFQLGLIIIEVKAIEIQQIVNIQGHRWQYQNYYTDYGNPYQQAENQLFALLEYIDREPLLKKQIPARILLALPHITDRQWQQKNLHQLPTSPPILFQEHLRLSTCICEQIQQQPSLNSENNLTETQWQLLLSILGGTLLYTPSSRPILAHKQSRSSILQQARSRLAQLDLQQEKIGKQIPPGAQQIRGIAGSGKTVILCQKAALMHLKYPDWQIAFVFFSRSLYPKIIEQIDKWIRHFTNNQQTFDRHNSNLKILHAWGGKTQPGFYSTLCQLTGSISLTVRETVDRAPNEALGEICHQLLQTRTIPQVFDAILIDEGQDLVVNNWKYQDKQPFYWLAYQALRPVNPIHPEQKRLIWAYDEGQSLASLKIPTARELLGYKLGHLVTGKYPNGINKTEIMSRCYRTPHQILTFAHGIGMGWLRPQGMLAGFTNSEEWLAIGYQVTGKLATGQQITLKRPPNNSPNPLTELWQGEIIEFKTYPSRQQELTVLTNNIKYNLRHDGLRPAREILVIILGSFNDAAELARQTARFLMKQNITIYLPSSSNYNLLQTESNQDRANKFWCEGAITITTIHRAKGQEADMVYVIGADFIAKDESNIYLRNQLFVALTRARGWVNLSGIGDYPFYDEIKQVLKSKDTFTFIWKSLPKRTLSVSDRDNLLTSFALGRKNFRSANLAKINLAGANLTNINFISANLQQANLANTQLSGAKLIAADLTNANLQGANLSRAKLMGANLTNADLTNADLTNADLTNVNWGE